MRREITGGLDIFVFILVWLIFFVNFIVSSKGLTPWSKDFFCWSGGRLVCDVIDYKIDSFGSELNKNVLLYFCFVETLIFSWEMFVELNEGSRMDLTIEFDLFLSRSL